jgi:hypothetical protein
VNQFGRLTNLTQLSVDTSWWTRYRSSTQNPVFGDTFPQALPTLAVGQHTAIPRNDADLSSSSHLQAIANTAGFHFTTIEQGGSSLYPSLAQRVTHPEVLRILLSIGGTEIMHFQTWQDKAGNAADTADTDPVTGVKVVFDLMSGAGDLPFSVFPQQQPWQTARCPITSRFVARGWVESADIRSRLVLSDCGRWRDYSAHQSMSRRDWRKQSGGVQNESHFRGNVDESSQKRIQKSKCRQADSDAVNDQSSDKILHDRPAAAPGNGQSRDKL